MTKDEALKLAFEALTATMSTHGSKDAIDEAHDKAITAIEAVWAQREQEPLPDFYIIEFELEALQRDGRRAVVLYTKPVTNGIDVPVYTTPPQRESLTDDAKDAMRYRWLFNDVDLSAIKTAFDENKPPPSSSHSQIIEQIIGFYVNKQDVDEMIDWAIKAAQGVKE